VTRTHRIPLLAALVAVALATGGCAYFNTFYSAKKSFAAAERLYLNPDDRATPQQAALYDKAILSATKLVATYPKSKYVDDAALITGRSFLGKGEYVKARESFGALASKFPDSPLNEQGLYYTAESYRRERKWETAQQYYDSLRHAYPRSKLLLDAGMREAQVDLAALRPRDAVAGLRALPADKLDERAVYEWHKTLADAYYTLSSYDSARVEYQWVETHARTLQASHEAILRQGDCLEGKRDWAGAIEHYRRYERSARAPEYRDQASLRRASALAASGKANEGLVVLQDIVNDKTRPAIAPEALYRMGFIQEVQLEDGQAARATYAKVQEQYRGSPFAKQAEQRSQNLDKIDALRAAARSDTTGRETAASAAFAVAERFLIDADRPERAIEEYGKVERDFAGTQSAPKASFAAGWVYAHKIQHKEAADSVWRHLVTNYPETIYGRAASAMLRGRVDSLRTVGAIGGTLMKYPFSPNAQLYVPTEARVTAQRRSLSSSAREDSLMRARAARADSLARGRGARADTSKAKTAPPDTTKKAPFPAAPADTTKGAPAPSPAGTRSLR